MFKEALELIKRNKSKVDEGKANNIPFENLPKLNKYVPGIIKGCQYIVTANSGVGKTQFTKFAFVLEPYKYIKKYPEKGLKLKILYFALEESKEEFMLSLISNKLKEDYNLDLSPLDLQSYTENKLSDDVIKKIEDCQDYFEDLNKYLEVIDSIYHPFGIYNYVRQYSEENGVHHTRKQMINGEEKDIYSHYEPNDPDEFVIVIADHVSLLQESKNAHTGVMMNKHQTMTHWSADFARKQITKHFKYAVISVQQQSSASEQQQFTSRGDSIEAKLEPSLDGLGDNKLTQRDALIVIGLFAPDRYGIRKHLGYDITKLKDRYRTLVILKNRLGRPNLKEGLYFDGASNTFSELPAPSELDYEKYI